VADRLGRELTTFTERLPDPPNGDGSPSVEQSKLNGMEGNKSNNMERLGDFVPSAGAVNRDRKFDLPVRVVEQHTWLARRSDRVLMEILVAASVHLAMRRGTVPKDVLDEAIHAVEGFRSWDTVKEKIAKIARAAAA
jgi:hypothetical protein